MSAFPAVVDAAQRDGREWGHLSAADLPRVEVFCCERVQGEYVWTPAELDKVTEMDDPG